MIPELVKKKTRGWVYAALWSAALVSAALCLVIYLQDRSLLLDSLNIARNVYERSYGQLTLPLHYDQSAPVLFLWLTKLMTQAFGFTHYALRLTPLLAAGFAIYFFFRVAQSFLRHEFAVVATFWLGTHQMYVRYASECKQYMGDVLSTTIVLWMASRYPHVSRKNVWGLSVVGAVLIWWSMPVAFMLAGMILYYVLIHLKEGRSLFHIVILATVLAISFLANYFCVLAPTIASSHMQTYHDEFFMRIDLSSWDAWSHNFSLVVRQSRMLVGKSAVSISALLILVVTAMIYAARSRDVRVVVVLVPVLCAYVASVLGLYSLLDRLMLYTMPLTVLLSMIGLQYWWDGRIVRKPVVRHLMFGIFSLGLLVGYSSRQGLKYLIHPFEKEDNRSAILHIANHEENDTYIVTTQHAYPGYIYYSQMDERYAPLSIGNTRHITYEEDLMLEVGDKLRLHGKVWVLAQHYLEHDLDLLYMRIGKIGKVEDQYRAKASAAFLISR